MDDANTCVLEGRLVLIRLVRGYVEVKDVDDMIGMLGSAMARKPAGRGAIIVADWRAQRLMSPAVAERVSFMLSRNNPSIDKSALLTPPTSALTAMQVVRLVREAENAQRKAFEDAADAIAWLSAALSDDELRRVTAFLGS